MVLCQGLAVLRLDFSFFFLFFCLSSLYWLVACFLQSLLMIQAQTLYQDNLAKEFLEKRISNY